MEHVVWLSAVTASLTFTISEASVFAGARKWLKGKIAWLSKRCNFNTINPSELVYFDSTATAEKAGYDYCAFCFGKAKSKR